jgi:hypothetical protein
LCSELIDGSRGTATVVPDHGTDSVAGVVAVVFAGYPGKMFTASI